MLPKNRIKSKNEGKREHWPIVSKIGEMGVKVTRNIVERLISFHLVLGTIRASSLSSVSDKVVTLDREALIAEIDRHREEGGPASGHARR